ncbi:MAG: hypothetical protein HYS43_02195 [Candidatus Liptonbacteria bacterium]|nr:hypothetical protein [Candidatus Liptonbacteria bacterium]
MDQRTQDVLYAAVGEYIKTGRAVSSGGLCEKYDLDARPATIRAELNRLTEGGYLCQPHTSGGRVPADKAYEFFARRILDECRLHRRRETSKDLALFEEFLRDEKQVFVENLANELRAFSICYNARHEEMYSSGLDNLIRTIDINTKRDLLEIMEGFEQLQERVASFASAMFDELRHDEQPRIDINEKDPLMNSRHLSLISDAYPMGSENVFLFVIGPKRMDYRKNLRILTTLRNKARERRI